MLIRRRGLSNVDADFSQANDLAAANPGKLKELQEPFEIGRDSITPVDPAYQDRGDFEFNGEIEKVTFELTSP